MSRRMKNCNILKSAAHPVAHLVGFCLIVICGAIASTSNETMGRIIIGLSVPFFLAHHLWISIYQNKNNALNYTVWGIVLISIIIMSAFEGKDISVYFSYTSIIFSLFLIYSSSVSIKYYITPRSHWYMVGPIFLLALYSLITSFFYYGKFKSRS